LQYYFGRSDLLDCKVGSKGLTAAGAGAKGVAALFLVLVMIVVSLCSKCLHIFNTFLLIGAGQARQQQDID